MKNSQPSPLHAQGIQWRWIGQMMLILLGITILPVIIAILIDHRLHTTPVFTLAAMFLGFNAGIVMIYRRIAVLYMQISPPDESAPQGSPSTSEETKL